MVPDARDDVDFFAADERDEVAFRDDTVRAGGDGSGLGGGAAPGADAVRPKPGSRRPNIPVADSATWARGARRLLRSIIAFMKSAGSTGRLESFCVSSSAAFTVRVN